MNKKAHLPRKSAHSSHFFLEKLKTTQGSSPSFLRRFTRPYFIFCNGVGVRVYVIMR